MADIKRPRDAEQRPGAWPNGVGMEQDTEHSSGAAAVPYEAVVAFRDAYNKALVGATASTAVWDGLKAAAPFIVAANQPQAAHCPADV